MEETKRRRLIRSLYTAPARTCYSLHECALCGEAITLGQVYSDRGHGRRAHYDCVPGLGKELEDWQVEERKEGRDG